MIAALSITACLLALIPALLFLHNLPLYRPLPAAPSNRLSCSVLIPARNEEANIAGALRSVLSSEEIDLEVIVLDDGSTDRTPEIVRDLAARDGRVRLETAPQLPPGWCGKTHACQHLGSLARHSLLIFIDADVRISQTNTLARLAHFVTEGGADLASGVPRQEAHTFMERLIIPLIHFVLLGFLPLKRMRRSSHPRFAAACGQVIATRRSAYLRSGGHAAIAWSMHDGVALARNFRAHGFRTDLFDATDTFHCRMYRNAHEIWHGFAKNAHEGLAARRLILPFTVLLLGGQVLPLVLLATAPSLPALIATAAAFAPRFIGVLRFHQPLAGALLHPLGICTLAAIQWFAFIRSVRGQPAMWKGRAYAPALSAA